MKLDVTIGVGSVNTKTEYLSVTPHVFNERNNRLLPLLHWINIGNIRSEHSINTIVGNRNEAMSVKVALDEGTVILITTVIRKLGKTINETTGVIISNNRPFITLTKVEDSYTFVAFSGKGYVVTKSNSPMESITNRLSNRNTVWAMPTIQQSSVAAKTIITQSENSTKIIEVVDSTKRSFRLRDIK